MNLFSRFVKDRSGTAAIEHGLIVAGMSVAIILFTQGLGIALNSTFASLNNTITVSVQNASLVKCRETNAQVPVDATASLITPHSGQGLHVPCPEQRPLDRH